MLTWPKRALFAIKYLFSPLQDIDIYVEDHEDEVFYSELFKKIKPSNIRIKRVFGVGGKAALIDRAESHGWDTRPALFLIDGDFDWVRGDRPPPIRGLHRLNAYCIENLLLHRRAGIDICVEEASVPDHEAERQIAFDDWISCVGPPLVDLFVWFAVLSIVCPTERTTGHRIGAVITRRSKSSPPSLDSTKTEALRAWAERMAVAAVGRSKVRALYEKIRQRVSMFDRQFDIVSGKSFLLPLFEFRLRECGVKQLRRSAMRINLARNCEPSLFLPLVRAIRRNAGRATKA